MHAHLYKTGRAEFIAVTDDEAMQAGMVLSKLEGIIPAIESSHAFAVLETRKFQPKDVVVFNLSGRGDKDLDTYIKYFKL
jgi:tryptophan synthase beta chain